MSSRVDVPHKGSPLHKGGAWFPDAWQLVDWYGAGMWGETPLRPVSSHSSFPGVGWEAVLLWEKPLLLLGTWWRQACHLHHLCCLVLGLRSAVVCTCLVFPDVVMTLFILVYCYVCMPGVCVCVCVCLQMEVRGQLCGVGCLLLPSCRFQDSNLNRQVWMASTSTHWAVLPAWDLHTFLLPTCEGWGQVSQRILVTRVGVWTSAVGALRCHLLSGDG